MADQATVDARGRSCPEPVIMTKRALDQNGNRAMVLVDNQVAVDNITRFADSRGLKVLVKEKDGDFELTIG
ncbi:MAG: preprotein translocase subunit TatB [Clostridiaceae bacterium]|jgi:tRNA 2-thiouridine synthesizing protein A|nr:preprotein translocase subunit TatB [Clostridiaceae bacterium]